MSNTTKLFLAFFINTAIITLVLQASIYGFTPAVTFSSPIPALKELQSDKQTEFSPDFDRNWYINVGAKITITVCFFIVSHLVFELLLVPLFSWLKYRKVKKMIGKEVQRVANRAILGPEFNITYYYASVLNVIFTTLFYSSGIPIMLHIGCFILTIQYWVYKYRLLRVCRRPPTYDSGLHQRISSILPWSIVFHIAIGLYMYGQPLIFPNSKDDLVINMNLLSTSTANSDYEVFIGVTEDKPVVNRAIHVVYIFVLLLIVIVFYIGRKLLQKFLQFFSCFCFCFSAKDGATVEPIQQTRLFSEEYAQIEQRMIPSYNIKMNEEYRFIIQAIDLGNKVTIENDTPRQGKDTPQHGKDTPRKSKEQSPSHFISADEILKQI